MKHKNFLIFRYTPRRSRFSESAPPSLFIAPLGSTLLFTWDISVLQGIIDRDNTEYFAETAHMKILKSKIPEKTSALLLGKIDRELLKFMDRNSYYSEIQTGKRKPFVRPIGRYDSSPIESMIPWPIRNELNSIDFTTLPPISFFEKLNYANAFYIVPETNGISGQTLFVPVTDFSDNH